MFLTSSLPLLPPPPTSLLPPLTTSFSSSEASSTASHQHQHPHQHPSSSRRPKPHHANINNRNSTLVALSSDERTISQRKMAIAMYGYSWLKPAGCAKTMLGRREEEVEKEEVDRQLREVELQERLAQEAEEQERLARLNETGEGEMEVGERDLDEDIPDADEADMDGEEDGGTEEEDGDEIDGGEDDEAMQADLDDEIPDADDQDDEDEDEDDEPMSPDPAGADGNWVYDTRREPDTDDEEQLPHPPPSNRHPPGRAAAGRYGRHATVAGVRLTIPGSEYGYDERDAEDLADAMLAQDEIFDDHATRSSSAAIVEHDLDDDVPEADDEQIWEHTDTELDESEMDISILPGQDAGPSMTGMVQAQNLRPPRSSVRMSVPRSSGPWITGPSPSPQAPGETTTRRGMHARPTPDAATRAARIVSGNRQRHYTHGPPNANARHQFTQTPAMLDSPLDVDEEEVDTDLELDTPDPVAGPSDLRGGFAAGQMARRETTNRGGAARPEADNNNQSPSRAAAARNWLDGAAAAVVGGSGGARRTLFQRATRRRNNVDTQDTATQPASSGASSGGLFTPSPHTGGTAFARPGGAALDWDTPLTANTNASASAGEGSSTSQGRDHSQSGPQRARRTGRFLGARRRVE
ncbi:uncharacterized protein Z520_10213 [Fonsecaea multimorphosa CBS 102226]|uniref:Apc15p protein n=1 Tax=Fonsecaea multimorphosa CBS 102226 TaxID=1442371 RepID=A0A0D2IAK4_9EURO|nr:uncharacterized protein Z520_10213 [Fonsecaea multimorphosa CBS 102226]KIX94186.1 hypothetical protein Z520_10213 [Fonsecaea multimorphosa CBS 102226]OAL19539.1 hypothetical protein AYO22_09701 [Fonsecaea multimorphosa]